MLVVSFLFFTHASPVLPMPFMEEAIFASLYAHVPSVEY